MRVLVLGGYGAVGRLIVDQLRVDGHRAYAAGRDPKRADRVIDLARGVGPGYVAALEDADVVVNASGREDLRLVEVATGREIPFVDITATTTYAQALERLRPGAPVVHDVGLAPGLTSVLATALHRRTRVPEPIDIALLLGSGERHGVGATEWAYGLLGRRFPDTHGGPTVRNYTNSRVFDLPRVGRRRLHRADYSDQHLRSARLDVPVRTYFALDSRPSTAALAVLTRLPAGGRIAPRRLRLPGSDEWLVAAIGVDTGACVWSHGRSESLATATVAVLAARVAIGLAAGVHQLSDVVGLDDVAGLEPIHLGAPLAHPR